uniref:Uncharacterized protein n=1 Tax=Medicago truncatula TaxID=3880 RepID=I3SLR5_MEDTR|nr:unknown [Medicago truncatula]
MEIILCPVVVYLRSIFGKDENFYMLFPSLVYGMNLSHENG